MGSSGVGKLVYRIELIPTEREIRRILYHVLPLVLLYEGLPVVRVCILRLQRESAGEALF